MKPYWLKLQNTMSTGRQCKPEFHEVKVIRGVVSYISRENTIFRTSMCFFWELQQPLQAANPQEFGGNIFFLPQKAKVCLAWRLNWYSQKSWLVLRPVHWKGVSKHGLLTTNCTHLNMCFWTSLIWGCFVPRPKDFDALQHMRHNTCWASS